MRDLDTLQHQDQFLFVVQVMSNKSKQDCIHNKKISHSTKMRICIHSSNEQKSLT